MLETRFNPWVGKIPWRTKQQPTPGRLPGKFHGCKLQSMGSQTVGHDWATSLSLFHFLLNTPISTTAAENKESGRLHWSLWHTLFYFLCSPGKEWASINSSPAYRHTTPWQTLSGATGPLSAPRRTTPCPPLCLLLSLLSVLVQISPLPIRIYPVDFSPIIFICPFKGLLQIDSEGVLSVNLLPPSQSVHSAVLKVSPWLISNCPKTSFEFFCEMLDTIGITDWKWILKVLWKADKIAKDYVKR